MMEGNLRVFWNIWASLPAFGPIGPNWKRIFEMVYSVYELLWIFLIYSVLGWCAGVAANSLRRRAFVNTGFLNLPLCPVYGVGAVLCSIFLQELGSQPFFLFLAGAVLLAVLVSFTGLLLERIFRRSWWDFSKSRFQFQGYTTMFHLVVWGLLAVFCIRVGNPLIARLVGMIPRTPGRVILLVAYALVLADLVVSVVAVLRLRLNVNRLAQNFQGLSSAFGGAITTPIQRRMVRAYPSLAAEKLVESRRAAREEPKVFAQGCSFAKMVWVFVISSLLGDLIETVFCYLTMGVLMSRSSLVWGPFSIVWGLGGVMMTLFLYRVMDRSDGYLFLVGTLLGGAYEYMCSVFTELVFGTVFWDYSHLPFNLGGRINLLYCFFWGIAAVVWIKHIYPRMSRLIERIPISAGRVGTWILVVFMVANMAISALALGRYTQRHVQPQAGGGAVADFLDEHFPNERIERIYPNLIFVD